MERLGISIIIITFESYEIAVPLDCLLLQLRSEDEVIIVDDHSSFRVKEMLERYAKHDSITLYESINPGNRPANRNQGAQAAKNQTLLFIDGDVVLDEHAIDAFRKAHNERSEVAFIGQIHGGHFDEPALNLYLGDSEYIKMVSTPEGRKKLLNNPLLQDRRKSFLEEKRNYDYLWAIYYSTYCSVERSLFDEVNGFDENCSVWGGEDVDLGYKISRKGKIGYLSEVHGFHIPHPRNVLANDRTNSNNFKMLYRKHHVWEFEILATYRITPMLLQTFGSIKNRMAMLSLKDIPKQQLMRDSIAINPVSKRYPEGHITLFDKEGNISEMCGLGIQMEFADNSIYTAYINDSVFIYPHAVAARILQEACRISTETFIVQTGESTRLDWSDLPPLKNLKPLNRIEYLSCDIMEYRYTKKSDSMIKVEKLFCGIKTYEGNLF